MAVRGGADHACEALEDCEVEKVSKFKSVRVLGWARTVLNGKLGSLHRESDGRVEILRLAVEHIGIKTPLAYGFQRGKKDIVGHFQGGSTAGEFSSLVHRNIHYDFFEFAGGTGRKNRINCVEGEFTGIGVGKLRQSLGFILTGVKSEGDERMNLDRRAV